MLAARRVVSVATRRRQFSKFAFVGAGKMAEAMLAPLQDTSIEGATPSVSFYDVSCAVAKRVAEKYPSLTRAESLDECVEGADVVVLCTKPQNCDAVFADLRPVVQNQKTPPVLLSILAGVPTERFRAGLGLQKVARAMPNTPGQIGCGVTVWTAGEHKELFTDADVERCKGALGALGKEIYVEEESYVDMSTSISGSGPAYIFLLIEAMVDAGVHLGVPQCCGAFTPSTRLASIRRGRLRTFGPSRATAMLRAGPRRLLARSRDNFGASDHPRFCEIRDGERRAPRGPQELRHFSCWYYCLCHL